MSKAAHGRGGRESRRCEQLVQLGCGRGEAIILGARLPPALAHLLALGDQPEKRGRAIRRAARTCGVGARHTGGSAQLGL